MKQRNNGNSDAIQLYMREIARTPLLTPGEEIQLAKRVKKGDKEAREQMIKANLRLVVKISHDYSYYGLPLLDLINEGNIGLMKAVERFDPKKGAKLSTYAAFWIKQSIRRALANQSKTIRLPVHLVDKIGKMNRIRLELTEKLGRDPTDTELAKKLDVPRSKIALLRRVGVRPASLDAPLRDDDNARFGDVIPDKSAIDPFESLRSKMLRDDIREHLKLLDAREATILVMRFGLDGKRPRTLEVVGKKFHVTRERIRQVQNIALKKLQRIMQQQEHADLADKN